MKFRVDKRVLQDGKTPSPTFTAKKDKFTRSLTKYFDASALDAHLHAADGDGDDSDLKWLQVIRGEREGVAKMAGVDRIHQHEVQETLRKEEQREKEEERKEKQKRKWEEEKQVCFIY